MRIVAGHAKGLTLTQTVSDSTRPTSDRVRETIFDILSARIDFDGLKVADLYAGTGALGLEAISRGASSVVFIETDKSACMTIRTNIVGMAKYLPDKAKSCEVSRMPVLTFVQATKNHSTFDLVLADPPYDDDVETEVLSIVASQGLLIYETTSKKLEDCEKLLADHPRCDSIVTSRKMGNTGVVIVQAT